MNFKKDIILVTGGTALLCAFFALPFNQDWARKIYGYWSDVQPQLNNLPLEKRKMNRYGSSYTVSKTIANGIQKKKGNTKELILLPPSAYFEQYGISYHVPEPAVFYYFTGLKTVWPNSAEATKANWIVGVSDKDLVLLPVKNKTMLIDSIRSYNKFAVEL